MKIRISIIFSYFVIVACLGAVDRPNIIFIMADDFGLGDIGRHHEERTGYPRFGTDPYTGCTRQ
jgi:hypothetical protein